MSEVNWFDRQTFVLLDHPWGEAVWAILFGIAVLIMVSPIVLMMFNYFVFWPILIGGIAAILSPVNAILLLYFFDRIGLKKLDQF